MTALSTGQARDQLYRLVDQVSEEHKPVLITGKRHNAVLLGEEDWQSIKETLHLENIPGMGDSIREGMKTPPAKMSKELKW